MKKKAFERSTLVKFYPWGLGGTNVNNSKKWEMKTLGTINKDLGHESVSELFICDILKYITHTQ